MGHKGCKLGTCFPPFKTPKWASARLRKQPSYGSTRKASRELSAHSKPTLDTFHFDGRACAFGLEWAHKSTNQPTKQPSNQAKTKQPSNQPTNQPSNQPTKQPTNQPTKQPSNQATNQPTNFDHPMKLNQKFEHPTIQAPRRTLRINAYSPCSPNGPFPSISIQSRPPSSTLHQLDPTRPLRSTASFGRGRDSRAASGQPLPAAARLRDRGESRFVGRRVGTEE